MKSSDHSVLFGSAYYYEYQPLDQLPEGRLAEDFRLMREAGFTLIRVGESVWSTWEPSDGAFQLDWLEPVLDAAEAHGISVILGTPTYAVPPWLQTAHPEIAGESATGVRIPWGVRQEADIHHPVFRRYAERIIRAIVDRYRDHPAVVGFQVDNEPGERILFNDHIFQEYLARLEAEFETPERLNQAWGLTHWAHRINSFSELWRPDGNYVPQYDLSWRRFQAALTTEYIDWQSGIVRESAREHQFVTTCIDYGRRAVDDHGLGAGLDVSSGNPYLGLQDQLAATTEGEIDWPPSGSWAPFYLADRAWATRQQAFLVTETNATSIGHPWFNFPGYDGQLRQVAWALIARGARAIGYWHWHTIHASWETSWTGILPHSLEPGRVYAEIASIGREIAEAGDAVTGLIPDARIGVLYSQSSKWALEFQSPFQAPNTGVIAGNESKQGEPDPHAYDRVLYRFHGGFTRAGEQLRILHVGQFVALLRERGVESTVDELPALVVPALYVASDDELTTLRDYAAAGGHLVLGVRSGYADELGRMRVERKPAHLAEAAGVYYDEFSNLSVPLELTGDVAAGTRADFFAEGLISTGGETLATYDHPHFSRWPAVTTSAHGRGRITYVGTVPSIDLAEALARYVRGTLAALPEWDAPANVSVHSAVNAAGERLWFVHNFSFEGTRVSPPIGVEELGGSPVQSIELGAWDVAIVRESANR